MKQLLIVVFFLSFLTACANLNKSSSIPSVDFDKNPLPPFVWEDNISSAINKLCELDTVSIASLFGWQTIENVPTIVRRDEFCRRGFIDNYLANATPEQAEYTDVSNAMVPYGGSYKILAFYTSIENTPYVIELTFGGDKELSIGYFLSREKLLAEVDTGNTRIQNHKNMESNLPLYHSLPLTKITFAFHNIDGKYADIIDSTKKKLLTFFDTKYSIPELPPNEGGWHYRKYGDDYRNLYLLKNGRRETLFDGSGTYFSYYLDPNQKKSYMDLYEKYRKR